jgi:hypothetical protein
VERFLLESALELFSSDTITKIASIYNGEPDAEGKSSGSIFSLTDILKMPTA